MPETTPRMSLRLSRSGITLVEVMITVGVLVAAIIQITGLVTYSTNMRESTRDQTVARNHSNLQFEKIRDRARYDFTTVVTTFDNTRFDIPELPYDRADDTEPQVGLGTISIDDSDPTLLEVRILVQWDSVKGPARYEARTLITR